MGLHRVTFYMYACNKHHPLLCLVIGLVVLCGPMHVCECVSEERGDWEGADSQALSDIFTFRYINLTGLIIGLVTGDVVWTAAP